MKVFLKSLIKRTPVYGLYLHYLEKRKFDDWLRNNRVGPTPRLAKEKIIRDYAIRFKLDILVETGTYLGDTIEAMRKGFDRIYSIELSEELYQRAKIRFSNVKNVRLYLGDSGDVLTAVLNAIDEPCLFWLDGHYSAGFTAKGVLETPIRKELEAIRSHRHLNNDVILIDDARCFDGTHDYPTLSQIEKWAVEHGMTKFEVESDIIRISR